MIEIALITVSFVLGWWILGKKGWRPACLLFSLYLIMVGVSLYAEKQREKVWTVTVKGETFRARNVLNNKGVIIGERADNGEKFAATDVFVKEK